MSMSEAFWMWFIRPFAEMAAGLTVIAIIGAIFLTLICFWIVVDKVKRLWKKFKARRKLEDAALSEKRYQALLDGATGDRGKR